MRILKLFIQNVSKKYFEKTGLGSLFLYSEYRRWSKRIIGEINIMIYSLIEKLLQYGLKNSLIEER